MTKTELMMIRDFVNEGKFSDSAKAEINELCDNCSEFNHLINCDDTRYVDYPQYWEKELIDSWLDKPLTDDEFNELSCRLSHLGSYDSEQILFIINDIRKE